MKFDHKKIEKKWQRHWETEKLFVTKDRVESKENFYKLVEFPYPSGNLHMGHWYSFAVPDIFARYKRMQGFNVLYPMGFDAFGLPAENAAIQRGINPADWTKQNIKAMTAQMKSMGAMFDWSRMVSTIDPEYYRWTQWIFLQFYKHGLAYRAKTPVNWCPRDKTVLANEQVVYPPSRDASARQGGKCDRCGSEVEQREREQWMYKITAYADQLLEGLDKVDWPEVTKIAQRNWIGKSEGAVITFEITILDLPPNPLPEEGGNMPGYITTNTKEYQELYGKALEMRQHPTQAEEMLWERLRANQERHHFRRQHIVDHFIVDFLCLSKNLIVEVDGDIHDDQKDRDIERDEKLRGLGFTVLRIQNEEVLKNLESVIKKINNVLKALPLGEGAGGVSVKVFTTRPDTLFGATYLVLAPEHELLQNDELRMKNDEEVRKYIAKSRKKTQLQRQEIKDKTGVELKGVYAVNPANQEKIPVWVADYVLASYGTGAIMAVPAHDERDFEFAKKYRLPTRKVIQPAAVAYIPRTVSDIASGAKTELRIESECYEGNGTLINSGKFSGMQSELAKWEIVKAIGGRRTATYRLRDWILSRQRYWGTPIPLVFCEGCGWVPVPQDQLPIKLPKLENYLPADDGSSPLARAEKWVKAKCPQCGGEARRETDTMDTFVDSSWYFLRYTDPDNRKELASKEKINMWCPVNLYTGGAEHNTMHLLYARFFYKALIDIGILDFPAERPSGHSGGSASMSKTLGGDEPFTMRRNHGIVLGPDGQKMSKSHGNVVDPDKEVAEYGADTVRMYLAFLGPYDTFNGPWDPRGITGIHKFLQRVWHLAHEMQNVNLPPMLKLWRAGKVQNDNAKLKNNKIDRVLHKTIKKVGEDIEQLHFNTAISELMILLNELEAVKLYSYKAVGLLLLLLAPFAPHLAEELWHQLGHITSIHLEQWPQYDPYLIKDDVVTVAIQISGKTRGTVDVPSDSTEKVVSHAAQEIPSIQKRLEGKTIAKTIFVKNKLINFVVIA